APTGPAQPGGPDAHIAGSSAGPLGADWAKRWWARRYWVGAIAVLLVAAISLAVSLHALSKPTLSAGAVNGIVNSKVNSAVNSLQTQPPAGVVVYNQVAPTMVVIQANTPGATSGESLGAGVVVSNTGEILTALHVVEGAT